MTVAVRWGGLLAWLALLAGLVLAGTRSSPGRPAGERRDAPGASAPALLEEPPTVGEPDTAVARELARVALWVERAVLYVGHPRGDSGTAFVISRAHRLLATNAHVASILEEVGAMVAVVNRSQVTYRVERVWYHPDCARVEAGGADALVRGRWVPAPKALRPDVAVLQLGPEGPDLPAECTLAGPGELERLLARPVGLLGFSGPPPPPGSPVAAGFRAGLVGLLTDFSPGGEPSRRWRMVDIEAPGGDGDSGGPVFSPDGRVVAISAWSRLRADGTETAAALRVDALRELLHHHGLADRVPRPGPDPALTPRGPGD